MKRVHTSRTYWLSGIMASIFMMSVSAFAGITTQPGLACDAGGNTFQYAKQSGSVRNAAVVAVFYWCPVTLTRAKKSLKYIQVVVLRPVGESDFACSFHSYDMEGGFVASESMETSGAGINLLYTENLPLADGGTVSVACALPPQGRIMSMLWEE